MKLPALLSKLVVDVANILCCQETVPVCCASLYLRERGFEVVLYDLPGMCTTLYHSADPVPDVLGQRGCILGSDTIFCDAFSVSCVAGCVCMLCMMDAELNNVWPSIEFADFEVCKTSTLSTVASGLAAHSAALGVLLC